MSVMYIFDICFDGNECFPSPGLLYMCRSTLEMMAHHLPDGIMDASTALTFSPNDVCIAITSTRACVQVIDCVTVPGDDGMFVCKKPRVEVGVKRPLVWFSQNTKAHKREKTTCVRVWTL